MANQLVKSISISILTGLSTNSSGIVKSGFSIFYLFKGGVIFPLCNNYNHLWYIQLTQALQSAIIWHIGTLLLHHIPIL